MEILNGVENVQKFQDLVDTAKPVIEDVKEEGEYSILDWSSTSPDLNNFENLWD